MRSNESAALLVMQSLIPTIQFILLLSTENFILSYLSIQQPWKKKYLSNDQIKTQTIYYKICFCLFNFDMTHVKVTVRFSWQLPTAKINVNKKYQSKQRPLQKYSSLWFYNNDNKAINLPGISLHQLNPKVVG